MYENFWLKNETLQHILILHGNVIVSVLQSDYLTCLMNLRSERSLAMLSTLQFVGQGET